MSAGFYKRRRGILEHLEAGTIGLLDLSVHDYLCLKINAVRGNACSIPAGVCFTSAAAIYAVCPKEVSERTIRRSLEHLETIGWIKRWTVPGKHGNYPVLVARASVHDLSGNEYRVSAEETTDWRFPVYVAGEETARSARGDVRGLSADREERAETGRQQCDYSRTARGVGLAMMLTTQQSYELLAKHGIFAREICDKCGAVLGAVRFTRKDESGVWCSRECRGDGERQATRKGGRPREYENGAQRQKAYRERLGCYETPSKTVRNKGLADTKNASLALPLIRPTSAQETACSENGGVRV